MKRSTVIGLATIVVLLFVGGKILGPSEGSNRAAPAAAQAAAAPEPAEPKTDLDEARDEVLAHFKSGKEPAVKDAVWTQDFIFKVGLISDGSDRSGYAEYVCNVLYDYGFKGKKVWVQAIDIVKLTRTNKWEKLGEAHCI